MDYFNKNIALATYGSIGIMALRKLFALGFKPEQITVFTYNPKDSVNIPLIEFLYHFGIIWGVVRDDMDRMYYMLEEDNVSLLLNIGYPFIYKEPVLGMQNITLINMHPGILPNYRGWMSTPYSIFNGEGFVGYTYHLISKEIDKGDIIHRGYTPIFTTATAFSLHFLLHEMAINYLDYIIGYEWNAYPQEQGGKYYKKILPNNGYIDIEWDDNKIERFIRAMYFPPYKGALLKTEEGDIEINSLEEYFKHKDNVKTEI